MRALVSLRSLNTHNFTTGARPVLGQVQLETTEILIDRRVQRSAEESCQFHNRADVVALGLRREMANAHVPADLGPLALAERICEAPGDRQGVEGASPLR
jgi:hypothetical protein